MLKLAGSAAHRTRIVKHDTGRHTSCPHPTPLPPGVMRKIDHVHSINGSLRHNQSVKQEGVCAVRWLARQLPSSAVFPSLVTNNAFALLTAGKQRRDYFVKRDPQKPKHQLFGASGSVSAHIVSAVTPPAFMETPPVHRLPFYSLPSLPFLPLCLPPPSFLPLQSHGG